MPAPQASAMQQLAKAKFMSFGLVMPSDWQQPQGEQGKLYQDSFESVDHNRPDTSNRLFRPASTNVHHIDATKFIGQVYGDFIDDICSAVCGAIGNWMTAAVIPSVVITGPVGILPPAGIVGIPLTPLAFLQAPISPPSMIPYSTAVSTAIGNAWQAWFTGFSGTLQFPPTFAACPSPFHPPTPNIPMPLAACGASAGAPLMQTATLKGSMVGLHGNPSAPFSAELFESLAEAFSTTFSMWTTSTMVCNVMGSGPNPLFVPPVPVPGPVLGGFGFGAPGCLS